MHTPSHLGGVAIIEISQLNRTEEIIGIIKIIEHFDSQLLQLFQLHRKEEIIEIVDIIDHSGEPGRSGALRPLK